MNLLFLFFLDYFFTKNLGREMMMLQSKTERHFRTKRALTKALAELEPVTFRIKDMSIYH
jgi:hypothetical protein